MRWFMSATLVLALALAALSLSACSTLGQIELREVRFTSADMCAAQAATAPEDREALQRSLAILAAQVRGLLGRDGPAPALTLECDQ